MSISQTTITGSIRTPGNIDARVRAVVFTLSGSDFENDEIIAVGRVEAECDTENGDFRAVLWPNDRGLRGTTVYSMAFKFSDGSSVTGINDLYVRHSETPVTIEAMVAQAKIAEAIKPHALKTVLRSQFDPGAQLDPGTVYLVMEG